MLDSLMQLAADAPELTAATGLTVYGPLGILVVMLFAVASYLVRRESARADRQEAEVARLNVLMSDKLVTMQEKLTTLATQNLAAMEAVLRELTESRQERELERRLMNEKVRRNRKDDDNGVT